MLHDVAGNYVFEHFAGNGCERYWAVVDGLYVGGLLFKYGNHICCGPVCWDCSLFQLGLEEYCECGCQFE